MLLRRLGLACLVLTAPLLAACGGDEGGASVGDVIPARADDQFEKGKRSSVVLPIGRLDIRLGEPVDEIGSKDSRELETLTAPDGATFVPITWQYVEAGSREVRAYVATSAAPEIDLETDGQSYRLPTPDAGQRGESFYVLVDGDAEELSVAVDFDGVSQSVDLVTGDRDPGRAGPLYDVKADRLRPKDCDSTGWFDDADAAVDYTCDVTGPVLLPYADGRWAEPGHRWLAITLHTELRQYGLADGKGGGAVFGASSTQVEARLGGEKPAASLVSADPVDQCPVRNVGTCGYRAHLIFDITGDDVPRRLEIEQRFALVLATRWGGFDPGAKLKVDAAGDVGLEVPAGKTGGKKGRD